jgi:hypothetical protein
MLLAAAALVGLGTGLGLLVKKYGITGLTSGGEAARPAPSHEMELLLGKLDTMQSSIDSNSRREPHACCSALARSSGHELRIRNGSRRTR